MNRLLKKKIILLVAAAAAVVGPTMVAAQTQRGRGGGRASESFLLNHHDDRALRSDANATAAIGAVPEVESIVNGASTGGPRPYMEGLTRKSALRGLCGGTLITPSVVLTAGHCMYPYENSTYIPVDQVLVNLYDKNDRAGVVTINIQDPSYGADIVAHPGYNPSKMPIYNDNDIAVMFLPVGQVADYAQINDDPHEPVVPNPMTVMGWGATAWKGALSDVLLETTLNYEFTNEQCQEIFAEYSKITGNEYVITDGMMCAYKKYTAECLGDSRGPLFLEKANGEIGDYPIQLGIVSWGIGCAQFPGVYTRVSYYAEWIKETVCSRSEYATKELCGSSKSGKGKSTKSSHAP